MHNQLKPLEVRFTDSGRITAVIASEYPVERNFGFEVLEITPASVNLDRFPLPVIRSHNSEQLPIGVASNPRFDGPFLLADLEISKSEERISKDIKDGILNNISIGYRILDSVPMDDGIRVTKFEIYEVSLVSVPADPQAKIIQRKLTMENAEVRSNNKEHQEIVALAKHHNKESLAMDAIEKNQSLETFRVRLMDAIATPPLDLPMAPTGLNKREIASFSIAKALMAKADGDWRDAGFEAEVLRETQKYATRQNSIVLPAELMQRDILKSGNGANLVGTDYMPDRMIDYLYAKSDLLSRVTSMTGLTQDVAIPRMTGTTSTAYYTEGAAITESTPTFDQVTLSPNTLASMVEYSRKMLVQGLPNIESLVRNDMARVIALKQDEVIINGSGSAPEPEGILNTTGIGSVALGTNGSAPTYAKLIDLIKEVAVDNADENAVFLINPQTEAFLRKTVKVSSTDSIMLLEGDSIAGRQVVVSAKVPSTLTKGTGSGLSAILYGNMNDVIYASFGGLELVVDPFSNLNKGLIRVAAFLENDIAIRHPESFAAISDAVV